MPEIRLKLAGPTIGMIGLGLSIQRRIVEKLGGQVGVETQAGRRCAFTFALSGVLNPRHSHEE